MNYFKILPFHGVTDYDIECEYTSIKKKLLNIMDNVEFKAYLQENKFEQFFNPLTPSHVSITMKMNLIPRTEMEMSFLIFSPWISVVCQNMVVN